jgi:hypothetical protein
MKTTRIDELLEQKLDAFERFRAATAALRDVDDFQGSRERIVSLINERNICIRIIERIDRRLDALRKEHPSFAPGLPGEIRERVRRLTGMILDSATQSREMSSECEERLARRHGDMKNQLIRIRRGKEGVRGQAGKTYRKGLPKFVDMTL